MTQVCLLYIEDEPDLRIELVEELQAMGFVIYGAADGDAAFALLDSLPPESLDCVICDVMMPGRSGLQLIDELRAHGAVKPAAPFLFVTALAARVDLMAGLIAGADDYLVKPVDIDLLVLTIRNRLALAGRGAARQSIAPATSSREIPDYLTRRDQEVLALLGAGAKNGDIAERLLLSRHTVNQYVRDIYRKLGINSRFEAAQLAREMGLVAQDHLRSA